MLKSCLSHIIGAISCLLRVQSVLFHILKLAKTYYVFNISGFQCAKTYYVLNISLAECSKTNYVFNISGFECSKTISFFHILLVECSKTHWFLRLLHHRGYIKFASHVLRSILYPKTVKNSLCFQHFRFLMCKSPLCVQHFKFTM